jgi:hypothetical protein
LDPLLKLVPVTVREKPLLPVAIPVGEIELIVGLLVGFGDGFGDGVEEVPPQLMRNKAIPARKHGINN